MKRHVLDQVKTRTTSGMKLSFSRIPLKASPHRETLMLQRRPLAASAGSMLRAFAKIERGYTA